MCRGCEVGIFATPTDGDMLGGDSCFTSSENSRRNVLDYFFDSRLFNK